MKHATAETLAGFGDLLEQLRRIPGLVEKRPGVFYRKSRAFLHFHEDPAGGGMAAAGGGYGGRASGAG